MADGTFEPYPLILLAASIGLLCWMILYLRVHAFLALIVAALLVGLLSPRVVLQVTSDGTALALVNAPVQVAAAFGRMMGQIGIVIALATIIGKALMDSGGAERIVKACISVFSERLTPLALLVSSYTLGIPVFFDTVFLLMAPLARALYQQTSKNYILYVTAIAAGASITHSLVPPTPGPLTIAAMLNVDLGLTILVGMIVAAPLALAGLAYGTIANRLWPATPQPVAGVLRQTPVQPDRVERPLPPLWLSLLPIVLPVVLIASLTAMEALTQKAPQLNLQGAIGGVSVSLKGVLALVGNANIALLLSAIVSMWLVARQRRMDRKDLGRFTASALDEAGMILLITSAGGAFGAMLKECGVGESLGVLAQSWGVAPLVLAWALAALLKAAQGSATVAMITAASILSATLAPELRDSQQSLGEYLGYHPVYLVMAIGCGSKIGSWMNDSGFWVVCKAGGLNEAEALRSWTLVLVTMGVVGLPVTALLAWLMPLV